MIFSIPTTLWVSHFCVTFTLLWTFKILNPAIRIHSLSMKNSTHFCLLKLKKITMNVCSNHRFFRILFSYYLHSSSLFSSSFHCQSNKSSDYLMYRGGAITNNYRLHKFTTQNHSSDYVCMLNSLFSVN